VFGDRGQVAVDKGSGEIAERRIAWPGGTHPALLPEEVPSELRWTELRPELAADECPDGESYAGRDQLAHVFSRSAEEPRDVRCYAKPSDREFRAPTPGVFSKVYRGSNRLIRRFGVAACALRRKGLTQMWMKQRWAKATVIVPLAVLGLGAIQVRLFSEAASSLERAGGYLVFGLLWSVAVGIVARAIRARKSVLAAVGLSVAGFLLGLVALGGFALLAGEATWAEPLGVAVSVLLPGLAAGMLCSWNRGYKR
jgi:hypothetical protein